MDSSDDEILGTPEAIVPHLRFTQRQKSPDQKDESEEESTSRSVIDASDDDSMGYTPVQRPPRFGQVLSSTAAVIPESDEEDVVAATPPIKPKVVSGYGAEIVTSLITKEADDVIEEDSPIVAMRRRPRFLNDTCDVSNIEAQERDKTENVLTDDESPVSGHRRTLAVGNWIRDVSDDDDQHEAENESHGLEPDEDDEDAESIDESMIGKKKMTTTKTRRFLDDSDEEDKNKDSGSEEEFYDATADDDDDDDDDEQELQLESRVSPASLRQGVQVTDDDGEGDDCDNSDDDDSGGEEEEEGEDEDDSFVVSGSDAEDDSPVVMRVKTPRAAKVVNKPLKGRDTPSPEIVEISPPAANPSIDRPSSSNAIVSALSFDRERKFTSQEVNALKTRLSEVRRSIESNTQILRKSAQRLPDNGARLIDKIDKLKDNESELVAKLMFAEENLTEDTSGPSDCLSELENKLSNLRLKEKMVRQRYASTRLELIPDKGASMQQEIRNLRTEISQAEAELKNLQQKSSTSSVGSLKHPPITNELPGTQNWSANQKFGLSNLADARLYADAPASNQLYGGRLNQTRRNAIGAITQDALKSLHDCLKEMPSEKDEESDPRGLRKNIQLFPHQRQALAWMLWRETKRPPGGILADDMGLGKTLTLLALIIKHRELMEDRNEEDDKENEWLEKLPKHLIRSKATLVICPASLIGHWEKEAKDKLKSGLLNVLVYHGNNRGQSARSLAKLDLVVTTYGTVMSEMKSVLASTKETKLDDMVTAEDDTHAADTNSKIQLLSIVWDRIILDEAHQIRNPRSQTALAVCKLRAARRWAVTGTPIQNKELDLYSLIRFFRLSPFDEYRVWKLWVDNKTSLGQERMNTLVKSMLLRRTKEQKNVATGEAIVSLPAKHIQEHKIELAPDERKVYEEVFSFSQQAMINYMMQAQEKEDAKAFMDKVVTGGKTAIREGFTFARDTANDGSSAPGTSHGGFGVVNHVVPKSLGDNKDVKAHHLLVLLLRLRQICNHPGLIKSMLDAESRATEGIEDENGDEIDLISQMADMSIRPDEAKEAEKVKSALDLANPVFEEKRPSSKIGMVIDELKKLKERSQETGEMEKAVIVSQWTSMLEIMKSHVTKLGLKCSAINGTVPIKTRGDIVNDFNQKNRGAQVMLLSLGAGGVGLNLVGANHLFLLDMHWNPQLEQQACDRIYRVGQKREVTIHKFLCDDTVESRILQLQAKKLDLANGVLTGAQSRQAAKMTFDDLKKIFDIDSCRQVRQPQHAPIGASNF